jgi:eukaryotic-like serine/threonine-protein kinase
MTPERWRQVTRIFHAALAVDLPRREAFLATACQTDPTLRSEVDALLAGDDSAGDFGETPLSLFDFPEAGAPGAPDDSCDTLVGEVVSHYRILEELGSGGMGVVYKAEDVRLDRLVALKFLLPDRTRDEEANDRFRQEARAASALDHANICTIHEIDETPDHRVFITMAYYDGETLKQRIDRGPLPIGDAVDIGIQVAQALSRAHASGIVHRDVKPANLLIGKDGVVKILDFGIATLPSRRDPARSNVTMGTAAYMSPEQIRGVDVDARADIWALGVVLYEMLTGRRPFDGDNDPAVLAGIVERTPRPIAEHRGGVPRPLKHVVSRALDKNLASRYRSIADMLTDLARCRAAPADRRPRPIDLVRALRTPVVAIPTAALLLTLVVSTGFAVRRNARARWARDEALPELMRRIDADDAAGAFALATDIAPDLPDDPVLAGLWPRFSATGSLVTVPDGADVYVQEYPAKHETWEYAGRTPISALRLHLGTFRLRIEKAGFETETLATTNPGTLLRNASNRLATPLTISLVPTGTSPGMVRVPSGAFPVSLTGFSTSNVANLDAYAIDRYEVTNKQFKQFVDAGGYTKPDAWRGLPFAQEGQDLTGQQAADRFQDLTGRPGPAGWALGEYAPGQDDYPVGGVSWFEAAAYCQAAGKSLPTIFHWARAALSPDEMFSPLASAIIPLSNFAGSGPAPVGRFHGMGPYGTYDMAGNVREWVWNESSNGRHFILGGAWNDPSYLTVRPYTMPPIDRSLTNGFRCARYETAGAAAGLLRHVEVLSRDYRSATAVSDEVFGVFKRQFAYATSDLNARVESRDTTRTDWIREKITFDAGYERARVPAYLFLPRNAAPPYQLVVYFPGLSSFVGRPSSETLQPESASMAGSLDFILKSGRALVWPVYKGSYERWDSTGSLQGEDARRAARMRMLEWRQDLGRVLDAMSGRQDIDSQRVAYLGASFGASNTLPLLALEDRLKVAVLLAPGLSGGDAVPEADAINYVGHITMPVLLLGGRNDYIYPLETSKQPLFERLGTPAADKRLVLFDAGHADLPRNEMIRDMLAWLDRYLGPASR